MNLFIPTLYGCLVSCHNSDKINSRAQCEKKSACDIRRRKKNVEPWINEYRTELSIKRWKDHVISFYDFKLRLIKITSLHTLKRFAHICRVLWSSKPFQWQPTLNFQTYFANYLRKNSKQHSFWPAEKCGSNQYECGQLALFLKKNVECFIQK